VCGPWSLPLKELKVTEHTSPGGLSGPKREKPLMKWRNLHKQELGSLCFFRQNLLVRPYLEWLDPQDT